VEGLVGFVRRNFMTPLPVAESVDAFNIRLLDACSKRRQAILRGHTASIAERMQADLAAFMKLPPGHPVYRPPRLARLGAGAHLFSHRLSQPHRRGARLAVGLRDVPARGAADHGCGDAELSN
jgi:hypothetical protein